MKNMINKGAEAKGRAISYSIDGSTNSHMKRVGWKKTFSVYCRKEGLSTRDFIEELKKESSPSTSFPPSKRLVSSFKLPSITNAFLIFLYINYRMMKMMVMIQRNNVSPMVVVGGCAARVGRRFVSHGHVVGERGRGGGGGEGWRG